MSNAVETIKFDDGYSVEIFYDQDAMNPMKDGDGQPSLVLHDKAEDHFGWTNDDDWHRRLNCALEDVAERGHTKTLHGKRGALAVVARWMRAFHGVQVILPVGAGEHSGTWTYLGEGAAWCDPGGWDSGWVGWLFFTREQIAENWPEGITDERLTQSLTGSFEEFASYVSGSVYGYVVHGPGGSGVEDDSCWGFYGSESYDECVDHETVARHLLPGDRVRCPDGTIDTIVSIRDDLGLMTEPNWHGRSPTIHVGQLMVEWNDRSDSEFAPTDAVTVVGPGYMRESFMDVIDSDRAYRARIIAKAHEKNIEMYRELVNG